MLHDLLAERAELLAERECGVVPDGWKFFVSDGDGGFDTYESLDKAKSNANSELEYCRDVAPEGWPDRTEQICYGVILGSAQVVEKRKATHEDGMDPSIKKYAEYKIIESSPTPPAPAEERE